MRARSGGTAMTTEKDSTGLDLDIKDAIEGHERFRLAFDRDKAFFKSLATRKQKPRLLWIGCSDSRVVPAQITNADPGELFEVRNIANSVPPAHVEDASVGAAIEYAVAHLGIDDIVVCGHTGCGGINALAEEIPPERQAHLGRWVELTRPAHRLIAAQGVPDAERHVETVKAHVQFQLDNLMSYEIVHEAVAAGRLGLHGWLYEMEQGRILAYDPSEGTWRDLLDIARGG